jgi:hypothetical protein
MCTSPGCPNKCSGPSFSGRRRRRHMVRAYIRMYDEKRKQHAIPIGWWCPNCHVFVNDTNMEKNA